MICFGTPLTYQLSSGWHVEWGNNSSHGSFLQEIGYSTQSESCPLKQSHVPAKQTSLIPTKQAILMNKSLSLYACKSLTIYWMEFGGPDAFTIVDASGRWDRFDRYSTPYQGSLTRSHMRLQSGIYSSRDYNHISDVMDSCNRLLHDGLSRLSCKVPLCQLQTRELMD